MNEYGTEGVLFILWLSGNYLVIQKCKKCKSRKRSTRKRGMQEEEYQEEIEGMQEDRSKTSKTLEHIKVITGK